MITNNQFLSPTLQRTQINSYRCLEVVKEEETEDEKQLIFNENHTEASARMLTAYTTPMKSIKQANGNSSSSGRSPFQEIQKSSSNQKTIVQHLTPNKNSVLKFR